MPRSFIPLAIVLVLACTLFGVLGGLAAMPSYPLPDAPALCHLPRETTSRPSLRRPFNDRSISR